LNFFPLEEIVFLVDLFEPFSDFAVGSLSAF
jgi:hypothetical protein